MLRRLAAIGALCAGLLAPCAAAQPAGPDRAELEAFVDGVVRDAMASEHMAGVHVAIVQGGGTVLLKGYGAAGLDPVRPVDPARDLFRIGSLSKTFTWIALMQAVEEGLVDLQAPANDYLPERLQIPGQGFSEPIRVIDLMSHTPGYEDSGLGHLFVGDPDDLRPAEDYLAAHRPRRVREPGRFSTYSNYGVSLAGRIIAEVRGQDFETVSDERIFQPLGMVRTTFREPYEPREGLPAPMDPGLAENLSAGFQWAGSRYEPRRFEYIGASAAAGSMSATAQDMATYMRLLLNDGELDGVRIYSEQTAELFRTPIVDAPEAMNGWPHGFMAIALPGGRTGYGHGGATMWFRTFLMVIPELDLGVHVSVNTDTGRSLGTRLPGLIVERFYGPDSAGIVRPGAPELLDGAPYAGSYLATRRSYTGLEKFVGLMNGVQPVRATGSGYLVTGSGPASAAWIPTEEPGRFIAMQGPDVLTFDMDDSGRATGFVGAWGTLYMERAPLLYTPSALTLTAALAMLAALATVLGAFTRIGRPVSPTPCQRMASIASLAAAGLWLAAAAAFFIWSGGTQDREALMYDWPNGPLRLASALALLAGLGAVGLAALLPCVWTRSQPDSWTVWRKLRYSLAIPCYLALAVVLGARGGLSFWS